MELIVLDTSLKMLSVLDTFESLIWTERYSAYGDFEVYTSINDSILEILKDDYYLWLKESDQTMIVEDRKIESDAENGNHFTVTEGHWIHFGTPHYLETNDSKRKLSKWN